MTQEGVQITINVQAGDKSAELARCFMIWLDKQGEQQFPEWSNEMLDFDTNFSYDYANNRINLKGYPHVDNS